MLSCDADEAVAEVTKIRKRCAPSSSRRRLRLKRSVRLIGRSGSPCKSSRKRRMSESSWNGRRHHPRVAGVDTRPASARKLVTALWQLDRGVADACEGEVGWDAAAARRGSDHHRRSSSMELSKLSTRKSKALEDAGGERRWHNDGHAHGHWTSDAMSNGGTMEAGLASPCPGDGTAQLQALYNSMTASKELVRVLANVLAPGALSPTAASLLAALRSELDAARARARQIAREQRRCGGGDEAERLREEMRAWKNRHREKTAAASRVVASELDAERRARQRAERVGKKLGEALAEAEAALREARREVDRERKARERMEKACDELAGGIGLGGAAAAEEYEYEMRREELEREREMLQLADELREERVRMKLAEARVQFEEKNAVVDRLRQELEAFLGRDGPESPARDDDRHRLQLVLAAEPFVHGIDPVAVAVHRNGEDRGGGNDGEVDDDYSDGRSDIELNVDGSSRDYSTASVKDTATTGKNAASRHGSFSDRGTEGGGTFDRRSPQGLGDVAPDEQRWNDDDDDGTTAKDVDEDAERYEAIKNLREQMLAGHGFVFQGGADAGDRDRQHRHAASFVCQVDERGLW